MIFYDTIITIPCNIAKVGNTYKLLVVNTVSKKEYDVDVEDTNPDEFFYTFDVTELTLENGTYQYYVSQDDRTVASGLIQVGRVNRKKKTSYDNQPKFKVYE